MNKKNKNDKKKSKKSNKIKKIIKPLSINNSSSGYTKSSDISIMSFAEPKADKIIVSFNFY